MGEKLKGSKKFIYISLGWGNRMKRYSSLILSQHYPSRSGKGIPCTLGAPGRTDPLEKKAKH